MHLLFVIPSLTAGGSEKVISELANYFASSNYSVSLIVFSASKDLPFYSLSPKINLFYLNILNRYNTYNIFYRFTNIIKRVMCLRKVIIKLSPNVIISFIDTTNITTLLATYRLSIPVIVSERIDPKYHKIPVLYNYLRLITYKMAKNIVMQTVSSANYFPDTFRNYIKIIPNVVAQQVACYKLNKQVKNIVAVGRLVAQKDHQTLIKSFATLIEIMPDSNIILTIYGSGPEKQHLEQLIVSLNLQNNIYLPGVTKDIISAIKTADLFVFPSLYEGFPNALCEAMAVGLPVIASDCSGNKDIIQDVVNGRLFPVGNVQALCNIMQELINNAKERERLSVNARKITETFSEEKIYNIWTNLIYSVSNEGSCNGY